MLPDRKARLQPQAPVETEGGSHDEDRVPPGAEVGADDHACASGEVLEEPDVELELLGQGRVAVPLRPLARMVGGLVERSTRGARAFPAPEGEVRPEGGAREWVHDQVGGKEQVAGQLPVALLGRRGALRFRLLGRGGACPRIVKDGGQNHRCGPANGSDAATRVRAGHGGVLRLSVKGAGPTGRLPGGNLAGPQSPGVCRSWVSSPIFSLLVPGATGTSTTWPYIEANPPSGAANHGRANSPLLDSFRQSLSASRHGCVSH